MKKTFGEKVLHYYCEELQPDWELPQDVEIIFPYNTQKAQQSMSTFYHKYFHDNNERTFVLGINPGRHGAGVTGIPFTGPLILREQLGIEHTFTSRPELSAAFISQWIEAAGGPEKFYSKLYITSVCPLGFTRHGTNYNFYDSKELLQATLPYIIEGLNTQLAFGGRRDYALCLGEGKNYRFFKALNEEHKWFDSIQPLSHPRYVMQYKRRHLQNYLDKYLEALPEDYDSQETR